MSVQLAVHAITEAGPLLAALKALLDAEKTGEKVLIKQREAEVDALVEQVVGA